MQQGTHTGRASSENLTSPETLPARYRDANLNMTLQPNGLQAGICFTWWVRALSQGPELLEPLNRGFARQLRGGPAELIGDSIGRSDSPGRSPRLDGASAIIRKTRTALGCDLKALPEGSFTARLLEPWQCSAFGHVPSMLPACEPDSKFRHYRAPCEPPVIKLWQEGRGLAAGR